jgi:uncharacterized membrane protein HdeD (DUF308 family)
MEVTVDRSIRHWWVFLIRGLIFILAGIYLICTPENSFAALGFLLGFLVFIAGIAELFHVVRERKAAYRGWHLGLGIIDILLGIILMGHVTASETILRIVVGLFFLFRGISLFSFSRVTGGNSWTIKAGGIITFVFGLMILFNTLFGAVTIVLFIAIALIVSGLFNALLSFRLKKIEG